MSKIISKPSGRRKALKVDVLKKIKTRGKDVAIFPNSLASALKRCDGEARSVLFQINE